MIGSDPDKHASVVLSPTLHPLPPSPLPPPTPPALRTAFRGSCNVSWFTHVLVHYHLSSPASGAYSFFRRLRWDFTCVQCDVCTDTGHTV